MPTFRLSFRRRTSYILLASDVELFLERRVREVGGFLLVCQRKTIRRLTNARRHGKLCHNFRLPGKVGRLYLCRPSSIIRMRARSPLLSHSPRIRGKSRRFRETRSNPAFLFSSPIRIITRSLIRKSGDKFREEFSIVALSLLPLPLFLE